MADYDDMLDALIQLRKLSGDSQEQLADRLGMHQTTLSSIERHRTRLPVETALKWAAQYGRRISLVPDPDARGGKLDAILAAATTLPDHKLDALLAVARGLPDLSDEGMHVIIQMARIIGRKATVAQGA